MLNRASKNHLESERRARGGEQGEKSKERRTREESKGRRARGEELVGEKSKG